VEWTELEIKEHMATGKKFKSGRINYLLTHGGFANTTQDFGKEFIIEDTIETQPEIQPEIQPIPPAQHTTGTQGFGKELANLAKMYTEDSKYIGENDNFDFKIVYA
jgi:hypothetical protein